MGIQFLGLISLVDMAIESHRMLILFTLFCLIFYIFGVYFANKLFKVHYLREVQQFRRKDLQLDVSHSLRFYLLGMFLVSCFVCLLYYKAIGGNVLLTSIRLYANAGHLTDITGEIKALRLHSYTTSDSGAYFAPGYVNQFKNTILPILTATTIFYYLTFRSISRAIIAIVVSSICLLFLIGTMQRAPLFWATFIFFAIFFSGFVINKKLSVISLSM
ncbi:hypothetical protein KAR91_29000, partial [Candidatus Pacearchaeota archaeon]|nr:hypothetical protein [Candidatus Pacearchaeota archaeon]